MLDLSRSLAALALALSLGSVACGNGELPSPLGSCVPPAPPSGSPILHGRAAINQALAAAQRHDMVRIVLADDGCAAPPLAAARVALSSLPESFAVVADRDGTLIVGSDPTGAMYGALEVADRIARGEALPPPAAVTGAPDLPIRAANLFLILPLATESFSDWWFYDEGFWGDYLDLLARARFDVLDLHGMYGQETTIFPNALPYFAVSPSFPDVGIPLADRRKNVAMLARVVALAAERGIQVGFMTYRSDLSLDGVAPPPMLADADVGTYTREATADLARSVPDLWRLGFRIHESTHPASWFVDTFVAGLRDSGTGIGLYTRSWGTSKADMLPIAAAASGQIVVESKYNGEQLGAPYVIANSKPVANGWFYAQYSYTDYLEAPDPYGFVFQIRSGGTHRLFRHAHFERIRGAVAGARLGAAQGISLEAAHGFLPMRDSYHQDPADRFSPWTFRRDEQQYLMFGRLAYDAGTPETVFRSELARRAGTDALWASVQAAGDIVPWIQSVHTCGPDQRHFAPDLEWGGPVGVWAGPASGKASGSPCDTDYQGPFDVQAFAAPYEAAADLLAGRGTSRLSPLEVARIVLHDAELARAAASAPVDLTDAEARDLVRECVALGDLGAYFGHKLRAATALAIHGGSGDPGYLDAARSETALADQAWRDLAAHTSHIAPFLDTMRMKSLGMPTYHWSMVVPHLPEDLASIDGYVANHPPPPIPVPVPPASSFLDQGRAPGPGLISIDPAAPQGGKQTIEVRLSRPAPAGAAVNILWKDFSGWADWNVATAVEHEGVWQVTVDRSDRSGFYAVEIVGGPGVGWRYPDVLTGPPYLVVPPSGG